MLEDDADDSYVRIDSTTTRTCPSGLTHARNIHPKEFDTLPNRRSYYRATATDFRPCLRKLLPSSTHTVAAGSRR